MIGRFLKAIGWTLLGVTTLCVVLYLVAIAINWRDQEPSATAVRLESQYRNRPLVANEDNAYVYVMGFEVGPTESPREMGLRRIAWTREPHEGSWLDPADDPLGERPDYRSVRPPSISEYLKACPGGEDCAGAFEAAASDFEQWAVAEDWLRQRYRELIDHPAWREDLSLQWAAPSPSYGRIMEGQELLLLEAGALARKGDYSGVRDLLTRDLRFWRRVLESSDTLLSKMIATAAINSHFVLGNLVLRAIPPDRAPAAMPEEWSTPISDAERSMERCLVGEWMLASALQRNMAEETALPSEASILDRAFATLARPLYKPQATINAQAEYFSQLETLLDVPVDQYPAALAQTADLAQRQARSLRSLYNPLGQALLTLAVPNYESYARRVGDVEGVRRASLAAVTMRAASVAKDDASAFLAASPLRNPYDGAPFGWDGDAVLSQGLESGPRGNHRFEY